MTTTHPNSGHAPADNHADSRKAVQPANPWDSLSASEPRLRAEEEVELAIAIEVGVFAAERLDSGWGTPRQRADLRIMTGEGWAAFDRFVRANVRLAAWSARRLTYRAPVGPDVYEDLVTEGVLGVIRAVQKWDYRRGLKFSTYAVNWIKNFQIRHLIRMRPVTLSDAEQAECRQLIAAGDRLEQVLGREPSRGELAEELDSTRRRVDELQRMLQPPISLDRPALSAKPAGPTLGDVLLVDQADDEPAEGSAAEALRGLLGGLPARQRGVIEDLFGLVDGMARTVGEVAELRGVPARLVAQTASTALTQLRTASAQLNLPSSAVAA